MRPTGELQRVAEQAQRDLLEIERRNKARLGAVAAGAMAIFGGRRGQSAAAILAAAMALQAALAPALDQVRREAARGGAAAAERDLEAIARRIDEEIRVSRRRVAIEAAAAWALAGSTTALFRRKATEALRQGANRPIALALDGIAPSLTRLAVTETSSAFSKARALVLRDTANDNAGARWVRHAYEMWDATLDKATCSVCGSMHGTMVPVGTRFRRGLQPGAVHPYCRCTSSIVILGAQAAA